MRYVTHSYVPALKLLHARGTRQCSAADEIVHLVCTQLNQNRKAKCIDAENVPLVLLSQPVLLATSRRADSSGHQTSSNTPDRGIDGHFLPDKHHPHWWLGGEPVVVARARMRTHREYAIAGRWRAIAYEIFQSLRHVSSSSL